MTRNEKKAVIESMAEKFMNIDDLEGKSMTIMVIDNVEEQRKIKEDLIQNTEEVEKVLAIREEMDAKQELKSKYAKRSVETTSGVERLQLRVRE